MHQDTAYVRLNRPMELAASWLALEDIQPGTGELEYYVGSHRIPEFLFEGTAKWISIGAPKRMHADLAHGGSARRAEGTRRSLVIHWCPTTAEPSYFQYPNSGMIRYSANAAYCYSFHGQSGNPYRNRERAETEKVFIP
ncbi:MAG TPA: phytanoyl-CoA dioxygenase family protein [Dongiaceae bacterium]|jgi:ectoine hydroxylase-related dioxygenase (phytanoyl-CoA dioxygenase family)|nr:phytanoyl-CoA dioxygenase family protein [Dongiaceae bacterium]